VTGLWANATAGHFEGNYYINLSAWLSTAAAVAVYGSHRIEALRREVHAARRLGHYRLTQRLGSGGMGEVYPAEHVLLRRPCAVKLIRPDRAGDPRNVVRFEREVRMTATLTHPNTVQIYDYGRADDGTFYSVMEYLPGENLDQLVKRRGPLPPDRAVHLLRQLCGALREALATGLIHRDIKPSNVIICEQGGLHDVAKLLDFGIVDTPGMNSDDSITAHGQVLGTPAYMSAEQAAGGNVLDARSDLYSLGATGYDMLTGKPPFDRPTVDLTIAAQLRDTVTPPHLLRTAIPTDVSAVILKCLENDPVRRFQDADGLDRALSASASSGSRTEGRAVQATREKPAADEAGNLTTRGLERRYSSWRPCLTDPGDDMVLELAVAAGGARVVSFNVADFRGAERFGVSVLRPQEFLAELGERTS
jgi:serine/threonine-protein kinase